MEIRISCDDGRKEMLKIADWLDEFKLKGYFYIAPFEPHNNLTSKEIKELSERHEICGHTLTHCRLTEVPLEKAEYEIIEGKYELEDIIGKKVNKFATPRGWQNDVIVEIIKKAGYLENRNTKMGIVDKTYYDSYWLPLSAHLYPRPEYNGDVYKGITDKFKEAVDWGNYFNLLLHTDELTKYKLWGTCRDVFQFIRATIDSKKPFG